MERFELDEGLKEEIRAGVLGEGFMKLVQTVRRNGSSFRISLRPVEIGGERRFQAEMNDAGSVQVKNLGVDAAADGLEEIIAQRGARDLHLMTAKGDLHVRVTKKGHVMASRSAPMAREAKVLGHDRTKNLPLTAFESATLLRVIGLVDGEGRVRASMRGKYDQVNEFLRVAKETVSPRADGGTFTVVDCGCGKAYLTIALGLYLAEALKFPAVRVVGIDRRADVIASARRMVEQLDVADRITFVEADLASVDLAQLGLEHVDLVTSLHACDTATDEALARAVEWRARFALCAPCCQHELQKTLADPAGAFAGLMRQPILRERLCDILTDSFRAMIMRVMGYRTQVIEFVSSEATARNVLIRCTDGVKRGQSGPVGEYLALRDYWKVVPWLETRLAAALKPCLERFEDAP